MTLRHLVPSLPLTLTIIGFWMLMVSELSLMQFAFAVALGLAVPVFATRLDREFGGGGRQRAARAIEVAILTGRPLSHWQRAARAQGVLEPWSVVLTAPRPILHQRILRRAAGMLRRGVIEETAAVLSSGLAPGSPGLDGVGIREAVE